MTAEQGKPLAESQGRDRLCRLLHRMVRARKASASMATRSPRTHADKRIVVIKQPIGVVRRDHAVELPGGDDHPQGRPRAGRGLHDRAASRRPRRPTRRSRWPSWPSAPASRRACSTCVTGDAKAIGGEMTSNPIVRKLTFTGSTEIGKLLMAAMRRHGEEGVARARRQRALHRVRRRRPRRGGRGRDRLEVPQRRPDLRLRQPHPGAGRRLRRLRREARRRGRRS